MTSMRAMVTAAVLERGASTLEDLQTVFPRVPRAHIGNALYQAVAGRHLRVVQRGNTGKRQPAIWGPPPPRTEVRSIVPSVFALGEQPMWRGTWPPATSSFAVHHPLGGWD